jgi:adenylosuccinate synthase
MPDDLLTSQNDLQQRGRCRHEVRVAWTNVPATVVVGTQWGDEGKAKVIDLLATRADMVVRFQGGHNAGHTVVVGDQKFAFRLIPAGALAGTRTVIGNGVVLDCETLLGEIDMLTSRGFDVSNLKISGNAHLIMPWHPILDTLAEQRRGDAALGTTKNGIGPAYVDKVAREGLRVQDLLAPERFKHRLHTVLAEKNELLTKIYGVDALDESAIAAQYLDDFAPRLAKYIDDTVGIVNDAIEAGEDVLFEGAQATFLDIDHGTYPFVTSSNPVAGTASVGSGVGPRHLTRIIGIAKAYVTRVGAGPFPTELHDEIGQGIRERGHEYGTNSKRPRRCGWFDGVMMRQAVRLNTLTELAVTKIDILDPLPLIKVCVGYDIDGELTTYLPGDLDKFARAKPVYEDHEGWLSDLSNARTLTDLPPLARRYLDRLGELSGVPVTIIGVGPGRDQVIEIPQ